MNWSHGDFLFLTGREYTGADFRSVDLKFGDLSDINFAFCNFESSFLRGGSFQNSNLFCVNFIRADLSDCQLQMANLCKAQFRGANLDGAVFDETTILPFSYDEALSRNMKFTPSENLNLFQRSIYPSDSLHFKFGTNRGRILDQSSNFSKKPSLGEKMYTENIERIKVGLEPFFQHISGRLAEMELDKNDVPKKVLLLMSRLNKKGARLQRSLGNPHFYQENHVLLKVEEIAEVVDLLKLEASDTPRLPVRWRTEIEQIYDMICDFLMSLEARRAS